MTRPLTNKKGSRSLLMVLGCGDRAPNADVTYVLFLKRLTPKSISNKIIFQFFIEVASEIIYCKPLQTKIRGHELCPKPLCGKGVSWYDTNIRKEMNIIWMELCVIHEIMPHMMQNQPPWSLIIQISKEKDPILWNQKRLAILYLSSFWAFLVGCLPTFFVFWSFEQKGHGKPIGEKRI